MVVGNKCLRYSPVHTGNSMISRKKGSTKVPKSYNFVTSEVLILRDLQIAGIS
jgi:hypothetical protein